MCLLSAATAIKNIHSKKKLRQPLDTFSRVEPRLSICFRRLIPPSNESGALG
jgi:hypothetical protein